MNPIPIKIMMFRMIFTICGNRKQKQSKYRFYLCIVLFDELPFAILLSFHLRQSVLVHNHPIAYRIMNNTTVLKYCQERHQTKKKVQNIDQHSFILRNNILVLLTELILHRSWNCAESGNHFLQFIQFCVLSPYNCLFNSIDTAVVNTVACWSMDQIVSNGEEVLKWVLF